MADTRLKVVSIMNYPPDPRFRRMCYVFLDSVIAHGGKNITLLYADDPPFVAPEHRRAADIELVKGRTYDVGYPHFNLQFKLPNLANLDYPFLYLDSDMVVLSDLTYLWERRTVKPWIGVNHQYIPSVPRTHRPPFLNSGLQLVSDPVFYDLAAILAAQNAVVPLSRHREIGKDEMFATPGLDQAVLFRYFQSIGYDYTHPEIGCEWNSCAGVTTAWQEAGVWRARTHSLPTNYDVHIMHYWKQFKPWAIDCPIYNSCAWVEQAPGGMIGTDRRA